MKKNAAVALLVLAFAAPTAYATKNSVVPEKPVLKGGAPMPTCDPTTTPDCKPGLR